MSFVTVSKILLLSNINKYTKSKLFTISFISKEISTLNATCMNEMDRGKVLAETAKIKIKIFINSSLSMYVYMYRLCGIQFVRQCM